MPDPESERFDEIVARLRGEQAASRRSRILLVLGVLCCLAAVLLITLGGVREAVFAVPPWLLGLFLVVRSRSVR